MITEQEVLEILSGVGAVITNSHIVYTSGKHGKVYFNKDALYPYTGKTSRLCREIAYHFIAKTQVVIAPAVGGCILSNRVAEHLTSIKGQEVLGVYADKEGDSFVIRRGYDKLVQGKQVLVVEDVITTGGSVRKVVGAVRAAGGDVVGVGALCNRGGITPQDLDVPKLVALVNVQMDAWDEYECLRVGSLFQRYPDQR